MRALLKQQTNETHRRLDDAFGELDLRTYGGYTLFLRAHQRAYAALEASPITDVRLRATLETVHGLLKQDLSTLGLPAATPGKGAADASAHPLGTHYVLAGSHFGKRVLLKRWSRSEDERVLASAQYLRGDALQKDWPIVLAALSEISPDGPTAEAVITGALSTFNLFGDSLTESAKMRMEERYEPA